MEYDIHFLRDFLENVTKILNMSPLFFVIKTENTAVRPSYNQYKDAKRSYELFILEFFHKLITIQVCIPVGCVPPAC